MAQAASNQPLIVKKRRKAAGHAHHGGAWKVAYADFVTAMMAFFLLLWLLNVTTDEQKNGIADYFTPAAASASSSGSGGVLGGQSLISEGARVSFKGVQGVVVGIAPPAPDDSQAERQREATAEEIRKKEAELEQEAFKTAEQALRQAIQESPQLAELSKHLIIDNTPEGLRIQLVDQDQQSMFPSGSAVMSERARTLIQLVAKVVEKLPNKLSISGHTDAVPFRRDGGYGNWELSADRANASRRALQDSGLAAERVRQVTGRADQQPLLADQPLNPTNRRISIVLLRDALAQGEAGEAAAARP